jgi:acyl-coenzyme A thioesterase PaaI-like protein
VPFGAVGSLRSFVSGEPEGDRLRVRYFRRDVDGALTGMAWFGPGAEGPPGHAHGGSMAALLDEAMGLCAWVKGHSVVAAKIGVDFRRMLPLETEARFESWVERVDGRKILVRGRLHDAHDLPYAESEGLFIEIGGERFKELAESAASRSDGR